MLAGPVQRNGRVLAFSPGPTPSLADVDRGQDVVPGLVGADQFVASDDIVAQPLRTACPAPWEVIGKHSFALDTAPGRDQGLVCSVLRDGQRRKKGKQARLPLRKRWWVPVTWRKGEFALSAASEDDGHRQR